MRVRITHRLHGSIDGIRLDNFQAGSVYEVSVSLACYLLASDAAEPVLDNTPASVLPSEKQLFGPGTLRAPGEPDLSARLITFPRDQAADRPPPAKSRGGRRPRNR
jgi:hypothetical protein